jgi:LuxR family transcriptional regulator, maltose regulon positive regulatory protein
LHSRLQIEQENTTVANPLLTTKLFIPARRPRNSVVERSRLTDRLSAADDRRLTLISAPAGCGKTTLLSEWIPHSEQCVSWLSLDANDNTPTRFWAYVIAALQLLQPDLGASALAVLDSPQSPPIETILTLLLNDAAAFPDRFVLVLDDYHLVETPAIHTALTFLLDHLPPQMQVMITSRSDPPLPLARWRARRQLTEIRAADLRFTPAEAAAFLNRVMGLNLSATDTAALEARTEGWIAGLQLAALSMQDLHDVDDFIRSFTGSHAYIIDYLAEEVVQRQSADTQSFLLQTSVLDRMCGALCDAVSGRIDSQVMLETLQHRNLFVIPLDEERRWFRYHHLFADVLRQRLQQAQPDLVPELHRRASAWFEQNDLMTEAIQQAITGGDFQRAARLIEKVAPLWLPGSAETLRGLVEALPAALVRARPRLNVIDCWILGLTGQPDRVEARLNEIEQDVTAAVDLPDRSSILGEVAALRAQLAMNSNRPLDSDELRNALINVPENSYHVRSMLAIMLGYAEREAGHLTAATRAYAEASQLAQTQADMFVAVSALAGLAELMEVQGQLHQAAHTHRQAIQLATTRAGRPLPPAGVSYVGLAKQLREWNELEEAARHLQTGIDLGRQAGIQGIEIDGSITLALIQVARRDWEGAQATLQRVAQIAQALNLPSIILRVATFEARLGLARGDWQAAARWAQVHQLDVDDEFHERLEIEYGTLAWLLIARRRPKDALHLLGRLQASAEAAGRMGRVIELLALRALALQANGDAADSRSVLERALSLAEPEGYARTFVDLGPAMLELLKKVLPLNRTGYAQQLIAAFAGSDREPPGQVNGLLDPLTEREIELLRLIAAGLSNREIADRLFLTEGTVKGYASTLYSKLGVRRRTEAVERARDLGLL